MRLDASMPFIPGIFQSMSTSSKGSSLGAASSSASPSSPEDAKTTWNEKDSKMICSISLEVALSSTTKTFKPRRSGDGSKRSSPFSLPRPKVAVKLKLLP